MSCRLMDFRGKRRREWFLSPTLSGGVYMSRDKHGQRKCLDSAVLWQILAAFPCQVPLVTAACREKINNYNLLYKKKKGKKNRGGRVFGGKMGQSPSFLRPRLVSKSLNKYHSSLCVFTS